MIFKGRSHLVDGRTKEVLALEVLRPHKGGFKVKDEVVDWASDRADVTDVAEVDEVADDERIVFVLLWSEMSLKKS